MADYRYLPGPVIDHWLWYEQAACRGLSTEMFFHPDFERGPKREARDAAAKAVCARCPVLEQCRSHALSAREPYGIWGGLTAAERGTDRTHRGAVGDGVIAKQVLRPSAHGG